MEVGVGDGMGSPMEFELTASASIVPDKAYAKRAADHSDQGGAGTSKPAGFDKRKRPKIEKAKEKAKPGLAWLGGPGPALGAASDPPASIDFESGESVDPDLSGQWADDAAGHKVRVSRRRGAHAATWFLLLRLSLSLRTQVRQPCITFDLSLKHSGHLSPAPPREAATYWLL